MTRCLLENLNKEEQNIFFISLRYLPSKWPWHFPLKYVCKMIMASHYYPCVRERICSSCRWVWGALDQELDVGRAVDLTDSQAFAEHQWIWVLFNMTKVALFGFSWLEFTSWGYFKLKLNKGKIISKKLLMLQPYFMLCSGNSAIVCQYEIVLVLSVLTKWIFITFGTNVVVCVAMKNIGQHKKTSYDLIVEFLSFIYFWIYSWAQSQKSFKTQQKM